MPIVHARVDERLIHGQVAMVWCRVTGAERIVVVNKQAVEDTMIQAALKMSKPAGMKLSILSPEKGVANLCGDKYGEEKIFLITKNITDMKYLIESGVPLKKFNVGNIAARDTSIPIKKSVSLTKTDIENINDLIDKGVVITAQMLPDESDMMITEYIKEAQTKTE